MTNLVSIQEKQEQAENRDRIFVEEYVQNGGNATRAAIASGSNESSASTVGYRLKRRLQNKINDEQKAALKGYSSNALTNDRLMHKRLSVKSLSWMPKKSYLIGQGGSL